MTSTLFYQPSQEASDNFKSNVRVSFFGNHTQQTEKVIVTLSLISQQNCANAMRCDWMLQSYCSAIVVSVDSSFLNRNVHNNKKILPSKRCHPPPHPLKKRKTIVHHLLLALGCIFTHLSTWRSTTRMADCRSWTPPAFRILVMPRY